MKRTPKWRVAAGFLVLGGLAFFGLRLLPVYLRNLQLQDFVEDVTQRVESRTQPDDLLRAWVLEKASALDLPVKANNVLVKRTQNDVRIDVKYVVRVDLPFYTVDLHFYPGAGSR